MLKITMIEPVFNNKFQGSVMIGQGANLDSTTIFNKSVDIVPAVRTASSGIATAVLTAPDDREIFKTLHDCMKDVGKFRQYIYYIGTSCDTTKLRNKIQKFKGRIQRSFYQQRELIRRAAAATNTSKTEVTIRRLEKCLCFTLASMNYYEDMLHKYSILLSYFPQATGDTSHVVHLGFEDSTINVDEVSYENHDFEDNETNRYIELLNQIQCIELLRHEIEQIDVLQLRHNATTYNQEFLENMQKYTTDLLPERQMTRPRTGRTQTKLRCYLTDDSNSSTIFRCNRRKILCAAAPVLVLLAAVAIVVFIILRNHK